MKEERRRELDKATRRLKSCETQLVNAKMAFGEVIQDAVNDDKCSLGEVARVLNDLGRPISRQRVHQIVHEGGD